MNSTILRRRTTSSSEGTPWRNYGQEIGRDKTKSWRLQVGSSTNSSFKCLYFSSIRLFLITTMGFSWKQQSEKLVDIHVYCLRPLCRLLVIRVIPNVDGWSTLSSMSYALYVSFWQCEDGWVCKNGSSQISGELKLASQLESHTKASLWPTGLAKDCWDGLMNMLHFTFKGWLGNEHWRAVGSIRHCGKQLPLK